MLVHACRLQFRCILLNRGMPFSLKELANLSLWRLERCKVVTLLLSFSPVISVVCCQLNSAPLSPEGGSAAGPPCHRHCLWQRWCPDALPDWWRYCLVLGRWRLRQAGQRRQWRLQSAHEGISCLCDPDLLLSLPCASQEHPVHCRSTLESRGVRGPGHLDPLGAFVSTQERRGIHRAPKSL